MFYTTCRRVVFPLTSYVREEREGNRVFMVLEHMFPLREWRKNNRSFRSIPKTCLKLLDVRRSFSELLSNAYKEVVGQERGNEM